MTRQNGSFCLMLKNAPRANAGVAGFFHTPTLDKTVKDRKHLVSAEVEKLLEAAKGSRNAARDRCLLLLMFRHGLRVSEACGLQLSQVDVESRVLHVKRLKEGLSTTHPLRGDEIRAIKAWLADRARMKPDTDAFFISERRSPICAYLGLFPSFPTPPLCHLLLSVRTCTGSLLPPSTRGRFLMDPTPWTATQKPMQVVQARLETGLRPSALHLLPQCIQP
jgi:integrase